MTNLKNTLKIKDQVKKIVIKNIGMISDKKKFSTSNKWDSLINLKIFFEIEQKFKIKINEKFFNKLNSIDKIVKFCEKKR